MPKLITRQRDEVLCNMNVSIRREFVVDAPLERAWQHLARIEAWPSWAKHIKSVTVESPGELSPSTVAVFHLAYGIKARFAVSEFVPPRSAPVSPRSAPVSPRSAPVSPRSAPVSPRSARVSRPRRNGSTEGLPHWKWISDFFGITVHYDHRFEPINHDRTKMQFIIEANDLGLGK